MLKFGIDSLKSISKFFSYRNDIDIYTEDKEADKEFYKALFKNLLGEKIIINDITPLGCKANVINAYRNQNKNDGRKKIFIVDGDLELINKNNIVSEKNLVVLDSYCIENYLIEENGIISLLYYSSGTESLENLKNKLNFDRWLSYNATTLTTLFINFAILRKLGGGPVLQNAHDFLTLNKKQTILDKAKVKKYTTIIYNEIITLLTTGGLTNLEANKIYLEEYDRIISYWKYNNETYLRIVSAKNYILPLLQFRINHCNNKGKTLFPKSSLKLFLASNSKLDRLNFLRDRIKRV
ncbi:DUF4435 domain-containing protein [Chryseobacterium mucoviscidosis]|uniref:DUF4435 domain-containing protein n=1 Tax=Chryseobacterium mucoviscidosis TaxID=1945581 RepID=UPI003016506C